MRGESTLDKKFAIAITGCVGAGKTTACNILKKKGYHVIDADLIAKKLILNKSNPEVNILIQNILPSEILQNYNIRNIGNFFDQNNKLELEFDKKFQPILGNILTQKLKFYDSEDPIIFIDAPYLEQKNILNDISLIIVIEADYDICFNRLKKRNNYSNKKISYLLKNSQISDKLYKSPNLIIINNNNDIEDLTHAIDNILINNLKKYL